MHPFLEAMTPPTRDRLLAGARRQRYAPGDRVLTEGDLAEHVFLLEAGSVRVFHATPEGREVLLKLFRAPALFGEAEALSGKTFVENAAALEACELVLVPAGALLAALRDEPRAAVLMLVDVAARLTLAAQNEKSLAFDAITVRLANYLVDLAVASRAIPGVAPMLQLTQDDMAAAVGATRRSISKDVTAWIDEGILVRRGDRYLVADLEALRRYADAAHGSVVYSVSR